MTRHAFIIVALCSLAGCGGPQTADETPTSEATPAERPTSFDPLVQSLERAQGVQQTIDDRAGEQRRRMEEDQLAPGVQ